MGCCSWVQIWPNYYHVNCTALQWRHNGRYSVSNHQPHDCLLNRLFRRRSKKTLKLRVTGLCVGNSSGTGEFPAQMASNSENVSIWWRHHGTIYSRDISRVHSTVISVRIYSSNRICIWQALPQICCGKTCPIWTGYVTGQQCFDKSG